MRERLRQFRGASRSPSSDDLGLASAQLTGLLFALFAAQHPRDVVHGAETARWLLDRSHEDPDLIAAALLHDVGKGEQRRADRVAHVLLTAGRANGLAANAYSRLEMRRALARSRDHSALGAAMLRSAGASPRVIELTQTHHDAVGGDHMLALLQQADALN